MPQVSEQKIERRKSADDGDETVEEGEGEIALLGDLPAQDEVGDAHGSDGDEDAEGEDKNGRAGAEAKGSHGRRSLTMTGFGVSKARSRSRFEAPVGRAEVFLGRGDVAVTI